MRYLFLILLFFGLGCSSTTPHRPSSTHNSYLSHTVANSGESLSQIARWYTGSSENWKIILAHNPGVDVRSIQVGDTIRIPQYLIVTEKPLPSPRQPAAADNWKWSGTGTPMGANLGAIDETPEPSEEMENVAAAEQGEPQSSSVGTEEAQAVDAEMLEEQPAETGSAAGGANRRQRIDQLLNEILSE